MLTRPCSVVARMERSEIRVRSARLPRIPLRSMRATLLPVAVNLVPLLDPAVAQLFKLLEIRQPYFHDLGVESFRVDRGLPKRGQNAELLDHEGLPFVRQAPVQEQLGGIGIGGGFRYAGGVRSGRSSLRSEED